MAVNSESPNDPSSWTQDERLRRVIEEHRRRLPALDRQYARAMQNAGAELPVRLQRVLEDHKN